MRPRRAIATGARFAFGFCLLALASRAAAAAPTADCPPEETPADDPRVLVEGRTAAMLDASRTPFLRAWYPGVTLHLAATGGGVRMRCGATGEHVELDVRVGSGPFRRVRLERGEQVVPLSSGIKGRHTITVVKRTEAWQGALDLFGFTAVGGKLFVPDPLPDRRLLFIGDSITCGASADIPPDDPDAKGPQTSNGRLAFGWQLARRLESKCHLVAYAGRGVFRDWQGKTAPEQNNAPRFYPRVAPDDPDLRWDATRYVPDAVLICLGTNDLNTSDLSTGGFGTGTSERRAFVEAYAGLVRAVRRDAPEAWVFLLGSPMFGPGERRQSLTGMLNEVVASLGDERVERVDVGYYPGRPSDSHPVAAEHRALAAELEPLLRKRLGWPAAERERD